MPLTATRSIAELEELKNALPAAEKSLFDRYFRVDTTVGKLVPPESMKGWIEKNFGSLERVENQKIVKVTNLLTLEGALFNEIRASRPMECKVDESVRQLIENGTGDPFCKVREGTPADSFGRVEGSYSTTASNIAKYDGYHGLVVFKEHNPLMLHKQAISDYFETAMEWAQRARAEDPEAKYYFFMWNCLWKSGASIVHGHAQMTLTRGMHYPKAEALRRVWAAYKQQYNGTCYFCDLFKIHQSLGLAWKWEDVKGMAYLTPLKEKEIILLAPKPGVPLYHAVHAVLESLMKLCVTSFNLALYLPPLAPVAEDWDGFPAVVRIVDRGDPNNKTADFGAMELYAASVISSDPFQVAEHITGH
ncbi:hypothetical protein EDC14_1003209 [Hydrogenispora ethanolica]|jgi:hypothetical protein|uniref:Galactose-1-phosphate uridylyltransferase n=1 Tax=Hydrogenispora ethanolica TaxID=1082276 RepID=A0A4V2QGC4_HYDET|nr:hypothetical protein [Hydrogenispora ethanolica]TCL75277.1 hypothetical protein EDC14_1003209 [Hydrogenispora ethanolica]